MSADDSGDRAFRALITCSLLMHALIVYAIVWALIVIAHFMPACAPAWR